MNICITWGDVTTPRDWASEARPLLMSHNINYKLHMYMAKFNRLRANKYFNCALRNAVTGARETQRIDCLVGG